MHLLPMPDQQLAKGSRSNMELTARIAFSVGCAVTTLGLACIIKSCNPHTFDGADPLAKFGLGAAKFGAIFALLTGIWLVAATPG
jgi:hypothetical protein